MIIDIKEKNSDKNMHIHIPRFCISIGAFILPLALRSGNAHIRKSGEKIHVKSMNKEQVRAIKKGIKYLNKYYKGLVLVDIQSNDGENVKIVI